MIGGIGATALPVRVGCSLSGVDNRAEIRAAATTAADTSTPNGATHGSDRVEQLNRLGP